ncbi:MAG: aldo/keto reductase [Acidimicrobiia bacterium]|nr:aldo/keto reductase [Acidimicrobiia bacterium]
MKNKGVSRRWFIGGAATGVVSTGLDLTGYSHAISSNAANDGTPAPKIEYRVLGRTGLKIPLISFGVMNSDNPDLLYRAFDLGLNHLDTAHGYLRGKSEQVIGEVVKQRGNRDSISIATKMYFARDRERGVFSNEASARAPAPTEQSLFKLLETSLQRLRTDYVDILYLHSCYSPEMATYEPVMSALVKAKEQGKARFIGVSTHRDEPNVIRATVDADVYDVVLTAYNYLQDHKEAVGEAIAYAAGKGVGVVAMKTQGGKRLQKEGVEINHQAALKWVFANPHVCTAIPGMTTFEQMDSNFSIMADPELSEGEERELKLASLLPGTYFCQSCRECIPSCPEQVEIPTLMRASMYAEAYGNTIQAAETIATVPEERGLGVCADCASCQARCRRDLPIAERLRDLAGGRWSTV